MKRSTLLEVVNTACVLVLALVGLLAIGDKPDPVQLEQAEQLYAQGMELAAKEDDGAKAKFRESAALLETQMTVGDSAGMHFNRANALLQAGELGEAIASYRAAQMRSPADARIDANLAEARSRIMRPLGAPEPTTLERACTLWAALNERTRLLAAVAIGFAALLALPLRARTVGVALVALGVLLAATVAADIARRTSTHLAVVTESTALRKGNGDGFEQVVAEALSEGTECRVLESRPGWLEVELGGGTRGWIREGAAVRVR